MNVLFIHWEKSRFLAVLLMRKIKIPCSFACKIVCIDDKFSKPVAVYGCENAVYKFIDAILTEYDYCKKLINEHFNKSCHFSSR